MPPAQLYQCLHFFSMDVPHFIAADFALDIAFAPLEVVPIFLVVNVLGEEVAVFLTHNKIMKGGKASKTEEKQKYLYAEPKFMIPPDPLTLPEPFKNQLRKEELPKKKE
jgi:hypothetical protein